MAEFCSKCAKRVMGEGARPEIDVYRIFEELEPNEIRTGFVCEGCGIVGVMKGVNNELKVLRGISDIRTVRVELEEY